MSLSVKISIGAALLAGGAALAAASFVSRADRTALRREAERRLELAADGAAGLARDALASRDRVALYDHLLLLAGRHPEIASISVGMGGSRHAIGAERPGLLYMDRAVGRGGGFADGASLRFGIDPARLDAGAEAAARPGSERALVLGGLLSLAAAIGAFLFAALLSLRLRLAASERLKKAEESGDEALHSLTHELNTPLSALRGYVELWQDGKAARTADERVRTGEAMLAAVARMEASLAGALLQSRARHRERSRRNPALVWVNKVIAETLALVEVLALARRIELSGPGHDEAACAYVEEDLLRQVLTNLLANALKYTPEGGRVRVGLSSGQDTTTFWVSDTGPGIAAADMDKVFERFDRSGAGVRSAAPGAGVGLAVARQAVGCMRGRIWVESEVGKGSTFYVTLPKNPGAKGPRPASSA